MSRRKPSRSTVEVEIEDVDLPGRDEPVPVRVTCNMEDHGIGSYEFWGRRGNDVNWCAVAESATLGDGTEISLDDVPASVIERAEEQALEQAEDSEDDDYPVDNDEE